jgi:hypothetical protein
MSVNFAERETERKAAPDMDAVLATYRPFADSNYISQQFRRCYERRLTKLSDAIPVASRLVDTIDRADPRIAEKTLADTGVRTIIQNLRRRVMTGVANSDRIAPLDLCSRLLDETVAFLSGVRSTGPLNLSIDGRLGDEPFHPWIWADNRPADDVFTEAFRFAAESQYGDVPPAASAAEVEDLRKGARLLAELVPLSSKSVLQHTQIVAVIPTSGVWKKMQSSSQYYLGGTIFLSSNILDKPWAVAELLYHESIHQKLYDFQWSHTLLERDGVIDPDTLTPSLLTVQSPWNYPDNEWDTHRVLAAFHVYVHLVLLCMTAEERASELESRYGPKVGMTPSRAAIERARYLGEQLTGPCWSELGRAGQLLVEWLSSVLDALDPSPPPRGAFLHLILNRYLREANRIRYRESQRTTEGTRPSEMTYQAELIADEELAIVENLLQEAGHKLPAERLRASAGSSSPGASRFAETRHKIAAALRECSFDGYSLASSPTSQIDPNEVVRAMIERSSRLLVVAQQIDELAGPSVADVLIRGRTRSVATP